MLCDYGCGLEAKYQFKNGKWCCSKNTSSCPFVKQRNSKTNRIKQTGEQNGMFGKKQSEKCKEINRLLKVGKKRSKESIEKGRLTWLQKHSKSLTKRMKEWQAFYMNKRIKNPSNEELKLREIVKELYPTSVHTYRILDYLIDIVIPEYKIAIEYDGWYHFYKLESIERDKIRQNRIENERWKFIRYNIFQKFPTKEQVKSDIEGLK